MGMIWLRVSLNERNLQTTLTTLLAEKQTILKFYDDHAFLRDEEKSSVLPTSAAGLGSVIFALTVCTDTRSATPPRQEDKRYSPTPHYSIHSRNSMTSQPLNHPQPHRHRPSQTDDLQNRSSSAEREDLYLLKQHFFSHTARHFPTGGTSHRNQSLTRQRGRLRVRRVGVGNETKSLWFSLEMTAVRLFRDTSRKWMSGVDGLVRCWRVSLVLLSTRCRGSSGSTDCESWK